MDGNGFPAALREARQRRHLSQLELAARAGTTQRHVSFVERGRSLPGRGLVLRLAESLELPPRERNNLMLTAGYAPAYPETRLDDPALRPVLAALRHVLDAHQPYPAIAIGRHGELVAANDAVDVLTDGVAPELLEPPVNVYRVALHPQGMAPRIRNLPEWAPHVMDRLRQESVRNPNPDLEALLAELDGYAPPDATADAGRLGFAVAMRLDTPHGELRLITTITTFATAIDVTIAELRLEAFLPADDTTGQVLNGLPRVRRADVTGAAVAGAVHRTGAVVWP